MEAQIVLWKRADGLTCLGRKLPRCATTGSPLIRLRWELQVWRGSRQIKAQRFKTGRQAVTAALTVWTVDFGLPPRLTKRH